MTRDRGVEYDNITHQVVGRHHDLLGKDQENEVVLNGQALEQILLDAYMDLSQ